MRPTSDSDRDAHDPARDSDDRPAVAHDVITDERRDPDTAYPVSNDPSAGPWAEAPAHLRDDDRDPSDVVPGQREPDHDGQLYVGAAHPDTDLTRDESAHHEPVPVDEHGDPIDPDRDPDARTDDDLHADLHADHADHAEAVDHDRHDEHHEAADHDRHDEHHEAADHDRHDEQAVHPEPAVMVTPLGPAQVVAVPGSPDGEAERRADLDHDGVADESPTDAAAEPADEPTDETPTELKPGDVPVPGVAAFLTADAADDLRQRWREAQLGFVDDPRQAAEDVRALVNEAIDKVVAALQTQREQVAESSGNDTEQYRVTVQRSRAFFDRLLSL
jgi:hypothetical protein